jgi:hypothetical protein
MVCTKLQYLTYTETTDKRYTHILKPEYEERDVPFRCCGMKQYTQTDFTVNRPDIIIKNKKRINMHTGRFGRPRRQ